MNPLDAEIGVHPQIRLCDILPQWPNWMEAAAPSLWIASVSLRRPGIISGRSNLTDQRRTQTRLAELHDSISHFLILGNQRTDTDTAFGITLGHRVYQYHILFNAFQVTGRDIRRTGIDKLAVHFIREQVKIILLHHVTNLVHLAAGIQIAGRIIRVTDQNSFCAFIYQLLELLHFRQGEPFLDGSRHRADHDTDKATAIIAGGHTCFTYITRNGDILLDKQIASCIEEEDVLDLTLRKVYDFAMTTPLDDIRFILETARLNKAAAERSFEGDYGHGLGKILRGTYEHKVMGDSVFSHILSYTSGACDARMAGAMIPVMSNSGSGNQGISATLPVLIYAEENGKSEEELIRALMLSHLTI